MNKKIVGALTLTFAACTLFCAACRKNSNDANSDVAKSKWYAMNAVSNSYKYPEYTGEETLDWKQAVEFRQIPAETLENMSTDGLIETCLDYPLYSAGMIFSNSTVYKGFLRTLGEFNGLQELMKRTDAPQKLLELYSKATPDKVKVDGESDVLKMRYLHYIMAQDEILDGLSKEQRKQLLDECMKKVEQYYTDFRDEFALDPALMIAARICLKDSESFRTLADEEPWIVGFAEGGILLSGNRDEIIRALDVMNEYRAG